MIEIRKRGRHFALYEDDRLLAICLYRVGAEEVKRRIEALEARLIGFGDTVSPTASITGVLEREV